MVVGVFVGFDDNRSLGSGETGAATPVPIFSDFMRTALQERPARPFVKPRNATFRMVNGIEEAFRPGTERARAAETRTGPVTPTGPQNYNEVLRNELNAAPAPGAAAPAPSAPAPATKPPAQDLDGLY
ncbi:MAG: hypothetical protein EON88_31900 [Brevundimonas sp.]|nr:MAG: hypothetical protein EON88_31900 [Brevundimonas sp.]